MYVTSDICNVVFLRFRDVTKRNGRNSVGTLYRELLGEIVVYYDNIYKFKKWLRLGICNIIECGFVCIEDFRSTFLLETI